VYKKSPKFIIRCDSNNQDFVELIRQLDIELGERYGTLQSSYGQYNLIPYIDTVVVGYVCGTPAGCGCFKKCSEKTVEIKRMYVKSEYRRKGIAVGILSELEKWAFELRFSKAILETGIKQPEAIGLYLKNGYLRIDNYGQYKGMQTSICFEKDLVF
jgi:GNAT superfamily N-acetyltransferase